jgi:hemerythrin-like metal-binding protein
MSRMRYNHPMPAIVWNANIQTGIPIFDAQHKKLIENINKLFDAVHRGKGNEAAADMLGFLAQYTIVHFRDEEVMMLKHGFPGHAAHKAEHAEYTRKVNRLRRQLREGTNLTLWRELSEFMSTWWREHIMRMDMNYAPFLRGKD